MASATLSSKGIHTKTDTNHLESFGLIWLDDNVSEHRDTEQKLRSIINYLKRFQDLKQCQNYIEHKSPSDRLVIIVSGRLGSELVPLIHKLCQVISVYVYCLDKKRNEQWSQKYPKVKAVVTKFDELISRIEANHKIQKKLEEPLLIDFFSTNNGQSIIGVNGQFVFSQVLIACLLRLKSHPTDKTELIDHFQNQYQGNSDELTILREFQEDYSPMKALWWYTREAFFYKTLNAALRTQDIHMIFLLRSFIADIHRQLQRYQSNRHVRVYRSQLMSVSELTTLRDRIGQLISINSFFSTSIDYQTALSFLDSCDNPSNLRAVVFEITADPKMVSSSKPFAEITQYSFYATEREVLFMLGSIFRLQDVRQQDGRIWMIKMTLCNDDENDLKQVLVDMKEQIECEETTLQTLGKFLSKMGKLDLAEKYFYRFIKQLPLNDPLLSITYKDLADLASIRGDLDKSVRLKQKALELKTQNQSSVNSIIDKTSKFIQQLKPKYNKWKQSGMTIAGGQGNENQLSGPEGIFISDNKTIYVADWGNDRVLEWKCDAKRGEIVAGGREKGDRDGQLDWPTSVIVDQQNNSLIISDNGNRRVIQCFHQNKLKQQILLSDIDCYGLAMDKHGWIYVADAEKNEVRRWKQGEKHARIVAGGNGQGNRLNQLNSPKYIFVDNDGTVYVSDSENHRVMKWRKDAKEGVIVAGGNGQGHGHKQLSSPQGVIVDHLGQIYVADLDNHRVMRYGEGDAKSSVVVGGNGEGHKSNQLKSPRALSFDAEGNLYVVDSGNDRIQKFEIDFN